MCVFVRVRARSYLYGLHRPGVEFEKCQRNVCPYEGKYFTVFQVSFLSFGIINLNPVLWI